MSRTAIALMLLPVILASALLATKTDRHQAQTLAAGEYLFASTETADDRGLAPPAAARDERSDLPDDPKARIVAVGAAILYGLEWSRR